MGITAVEHKTGAGGPGAGAGTVICRLGVLATMVPTDPKPKGFIRISKKGDGANNPYYEYASDGLTGADRQYIPVGMNIARPDDLGAHPIENYGANNLLAGIGDYVGYDGTGGWHKKMTEKKSGAQ